MHNMKDSSTYGDHLTLQAAACAYGVNVFVVDATDESKCLAISNSTGAEGSVDEQTHTHRNATELLASQTQIVLIGYYNEDNGAHYVSLKFESKECLHSIAKRVFANRLPAAVDSELENTMETIAADPPEVIQDAQDPAQADEATVSNETPFGMKLCSWQEWKRSRPWLSCERGRVFCTVCRNMVGKTVVFVDSNEMWEDQAFTVLGVQAQTSKKLLKKIDKHVKAKRHVACVRSAKIAASEPAEKALSVQNTRFEELHAHQIVATEKVFRVAYMCAKENLPFAKHPAIEPISAEWC